VAPSSLAALWQNGLRAPLSVGSPRPQHRATVCTPSGQTLRGQLRPDDGQLPLEAGAWHVLRDIFWKTPEFSLSIALVK
jgi:hypothetical protein